MEEREREEYTEEENEEYERYVEEYEKVELETLPCHSCCTPFYCDSCLAYVKRIIKEMFEKLSPRNQKRAKEEGYF